MTIVISRGTMQVQRDTRVYSKIDYTKFIGLKHFLFAKLSELREVFSVNVVPFCNYLIVDDFSVAYFVAFLFIGVG